MKKLKILISCYACSPLKGSEPGMGWNFILGISQFHEVHVLVEKEKWEKDIKEFMELNPEFRENLKFYFVQKKRNRKLRKIWPPSYYYYYRQWQREVFRLAESLMILESFDLIHQLNMVGFREPGYLWKFNKPFVWGPIGGMQNTPWSFIYSFNLKGILFYTGRNLLNSFQIKFLKRPKQAASGKLVSLIAATPETKDDIFKYWGIDSKIITEVGTKNRFLESINIRKLNDPLNIVWSGQHTSGKALNILLVSLSLLPKEIKWTLNILGSGYMTKKWKEKAKELDMMDNCNWYGWLPLNEAEHVMRKGHLFCISSLQDLTSSVTMEAISFGLPIICLDHCGFSHVVDDTCGIKIPVTKPKEVFSEFANSIEKLYNDELLRQKLSKGSLVRSTSFTWSKKIENLNKIYNDLIDESINNS